MDDLLGNSNGEKEVFERVSEQFEHTCNLSWEQRIFGFSCSFCLGVLLGIYSTFEVTSLINGNPSAFAVPYALGAITTLLSTMFLMNPISQLKRMFHAKRRTATIVYLSSIILTLIFAYGTYSTILVLLSVCVQFCALLWYSLSYIPYGRETVMSCCKKSVGL